MANNTETDEVTVTREPKATPTMWFTAFWRALRNDDRDRAQEALLELKRLGINVSFDESKSEAGDESEVTRHEA